MPADALVDGFLILLAGIFLITPGVLTDFVGIGLLTPPIRSLFKRGMQVWIRKHFEIRVAGLNASSWQNGDAVSPRAGDDKFIDARVLNTRV
jgi:UPF0716 protein FxsA